jgi:hypothetical protein
MEAGAGLEFNIFYWEGLQCSCSYEERNIWNIYNQDQKHSNENIQTVTEVTEQWCRIYN